MPSAAELQAQLWEAFNALPKPATVDAVKECAAQKLQGKQLAGFNAWLEKNETYLLGRING